MAGERVERLGHRDLERVVAWLHRGFGAMVTTCAEDSGWVLH